MTKFVARNSLVAGSSTGGSHTCSSGRDGLKGGMTCIQNVRTDSTTSATAVKLGEREE